jgi:hypothetical protein
LNNLKTSEQVIIRIERSPHFSFRERTLWQWRKLSSFTCDKQKTFVARNYCMVLGVVFLVGLGIAEVYHHPARIARQDTWEHYGRYVGAGFVDFANRSMYR